MDCFKDFDDFPFLMTDAILIKEIPQLSRSYSDQSFLGPFTEPIERTAVNQRREHSQPCGKSLTDGTHGNNDMNILPDPAQILPKDVHLVGLESLLQAICLACVHDIFHVLFVVDTCDIARV